MKRSDQTAIGGACEEFLTTHWSLIERVQSGEEGSEALIGSLVQQYWKPVYCFLRKRGHDNERAKDLSQGFFQEIVLGRELIRRFHRDKGSFRRFLLTSLEHYLQSIHRKEATRKRHPTGKWIPLQDVDPAELDVSTQLPTAEDSFNYTWLASLLDEVLAEVEADCQTHGLEVHWRIFNDRVLAPIIHGT